ncbi:LacI family sucrose operon transcriptional repressor [Natronobacillus azotifigens]|uniref:LacI family DNA-binding transcriptional regulator n=1 Tax=Natronobacillus azotifigens TaxID=472978 RepID=A0A9J6R9N9_9BACI|nr:LacI family DNA-binding transcriptional regulator [Natronobacillus azotifigens]MCZ0702019.1 LacI family DNA-binding transcriptional regulator [Natronobacillus azotifigens]
MKIKDIAKLAGVSPATVSRVMNNSGYVIDEKRKAVEKVIAEVGYTPNEIAKSLKNRKTNIIGVIVPKISTETASRVVDGITEVAKAHDCQILIANTDLQIEEEIKSLKFLSNRLVDGIIMMATEVTEQHYKVAKGISVPIVMVGQQVDGYPSIIHDDYHAAKAMMKHILAKGHQEIGFIGVSPHDIAVGIKRKQAYLDALSEAKLEVDDQLIAIGNFSIESGYEQMEKILAHKQPTAVMAVTDQLAIGAIHCIRDHRLTVPEDISITGMGDGKLSKYFIPPLTTVRLHHKTTGIMAAKNLFTLIENGYVKNEMVVDFSLRIRESVDEKEK